MANTDIFSEIVDQAIRFNPALSQLRIVVEKELLHHDILRTMKEMGLFKNLTFIGGTCLRAVYGSNRLSEDLDFTASKQFGQSDMDSFVHLLSSKITQKYQLPITVTPPKKSDGLVTTWKVKVVTRPQSKDIPTQRVNIDICAIPSYDVIPQTLKNHYGVNTGTESMIIPTQSLEEIYADKIVAFAFRPNKLKYRDIWDIVWLSEKSIECPKELVIKKIADHQQTMSKFIHAIDARVEQLKSLKKEFFDEMRRFLPMKIVQENLHEPLYWEYVCTLITQQTTPIVQAVKEAINAKPRSFSAAYQRKQNALAKIKLELETSLETTYLISLVDDTLALFDTPKEGATEILSELGQSVGKLPIESQTKLLRLLSSKN